jgi:hypothetical protein
MRWKRLSHPTFAPIQSGHFVTIHHLLYMWPEDEDEDEVMRMTRTT